MDCFFLICPYCRPTIIIIFLQLTAHFGNILQVTLKDISHALQKAYFDHMVDHGDCAYWSSSLLSLLDSSCVNPFSSIFSKCPLDYHFTLRGHDFTLAVMPSFWNWNCQLQALWLHFLLVSTTQTDRIDTVTLLPERSTYFRCLYANDLMCGKCGKWFLTPIQPFWLYQGETQFVY